jgi:enoyl-CoA hydratase/carnithine racemase
MEHSSEDWVVVSTHSDGVVELQLNRTDSMNAISAAFAQRLVAATQGLSANRDLRVLVVTSSSERAFCVGADLKERSKLTEQQLMKGRPGLQAAYRALWDVQVPVVAAVSGFALGGGLELALTCDVIVADSTTIVGLPEVTVGVIPAGGGTQLLARRTGYGIASDLLLTGRRVGAEEAFSLRIVERLATEGTARELALSLATQMAHSSPLALTSAKVALRASWGLDLDRGYSVEDSLWRSVSASGDRVEGALAFVDKRIPNWPSGRQHTDY